MKKKKINVKKKLNKKIGNKSSKNKSEKMEIKKLVIERTENNLVKQSQSSEVSNKVEKRK